MSKPIVSVQMYSLRDSVEQEGLDAVLAAVKESGFEGVELAGTYGLSAAALQQKIADAGLTVTSAHVSVAELANPETLATTYAPLGITDFFCAWSDAAPAHVATLVAAQKALPKYRIGYHNHAHEFEPQNKPFLDALFASTVLLEPDIFWLKVAGLDPITFLQQHADKVAAVHMKELSALGKDAPNPIPGQGVSGAKEALAFAVKHKHPYIVLEVENFDVPYRDYLAATAKFVQENMK